MKWELTGLRMVNDQFIRAQLAEGCFLWYGLSRMTLATHAVVGAAIGSVLPAHPVLAAALGFGSHFLLDSLPHWDYQLASAQKDPTNPLNDDLVLGKAFLADLVKIGFDLVLGFVLAYAFFQPTDRALIWSLYAGALGAVLPDFLQFVYFKIRRWPFSALQRLHLWIHTKHQIKYRPVLGVGLQAFLVLAIVLYVYYS